MLQSTTTALYEAFDVLLLDLDGVCYLGSKPAPHAAEGLAEAAEHGIRRHFVTNNASRAPEVVAEHLTELDIPTEPSQVLNSAQAGVLLASKLIPAGSKILRIGGAGLTAAIKDAGFEEVTTADAKPAAVVHGFAADVSWKELSEAALAIRYHGAKYVATNLDATLPMERGEMLGNGSLVAAVVHATGVTPVSAGKPEKEIFELAVEMSKATHPVAVGDRLETDILGANNAGIPAFHVLTGVSQAVDICLAEPRMRPAFLGVDLRDLSAVQHEVAEHDGAHQCCDARVAGTSIDELTIDGAPAHEYLAAQPLDLEHYRAFVAHVWAIVDALTPEERDEFAAQFRAAYPSLTVER